MKNPLPYLLLLLASLFLIIVGLQLYFNFTTWKSEKDIFQRKVQESLLQAKDLTLEQHLETSIQHLAGFLRDSTRITCKWNEEASATRFTIRDLDTSSKGQHQITLSLEQITGRYDSITPTLLESFIQQFCSNIRSDLRDASVWYYTVNIGRFIEKYYLHRPIPLAQMEKQFRSALTKQGIHYAFEVNTKTDKGFTTEKIDLALYKPHGPHYFWAQFDPPFTYFLKQQVLALMGSLLLIGLAALTFFFVYKVIYTQEKLSEEKDQFISNVTHELQTPVTAIQLAVDALHHLDCTEEEKRNFVNLIRKNSRALTEITTDILEEARSGLPKESFSLKTVVDEAIVLFPHLHVEIIARDDIFIYAERKHWLRLFQNLLDNACKYNHTDWPSARVEIVNSKAKLKITVADNGTGIPEKYHSRIFERFYRVPTQEVHDIRGFGIGLSFVQKTVERQKGVIQVSHGTDGGSIFTIYIPR